MDRPSPTVFVSYRRADTGWTAVALADALRRWRVVPFLDNSSIALGAEFADVLADAVRGAAVLVALIGPDWDRPPLSDRLADERDWVRRELLLAEEHGVEIVPVLVDRAGPPDPVRLPGELRFLAGRQCGTLRQRHPDDVDRLAQRLAELVGPAGGRSETGPRAPADATGRGAPRTRGAVQDLLRHILPPVQQWSGNRDRLVDLVLAALGPHDRLRYLAPARWAGHPRGSAAVLVTETDMTVVDVGEDFRIRGQLGLPLASIRQVEVVPTLPLFADVAVHTAAGAPVVLRGLFRDQARRLADHLRGEG